MDFAVPAQMVAEPWYWRNVQECAQRAGISATARAPTAHPPMLPFAVRFDLPAMCLGGIANGQ